MAACLARSAGLRWTGPGRWLRPHPGTATLVSYRAAGGPPSSTIVLPGSGGHKLKTVQDLPKVGLLEIMYRMVFQGYYNRLHDLQIYEKQLYGPIYVGGFKTVSLSSGKLLEEVLRQEEKFPHRGEMSLWTDYRDLRGFGYGPFTEEGHDWYNLRAHLNKRMLHPRDAVQYGPVINDVVTDLIKHIRYLRRASPCGTLVTNVSNNLYLFSLEAISTVLFETRIGCLEEEIPGGTQHFIDSIAQMFANSAAVMLLPKWAQRFVPHWHRYIAGWDGIFKFAGQLIDRKVEEIERRAGEQQEVEGEYLTYLLSNTQLSRKEVYGSVTELLLAGVDTTSNTLMWALHLLSRNPEVQETLYKEVSGSTTADHVLSAEDDISCCCNECKNNNRKGRCYWRIPFSKELHDEETFPEPWRFEPARWLRDGRERPYPFGSIPFGYGMIKQFKVEPDPTVGEIKPLTRTVLVADRQTGFGFCHYAISHDEETFPEPWRFEPARWLRDGRERPYPFGSIPFGYGVRGCVGRRIAELELYLALARVSTDRKELHA
ncbi:hypothetical protein CRUP_005316 [Coryphaenoides rupestris]|nr:hypothetical protein CRUP_005316 [Coryphaenoides rupestris]